MSAVEHYEYYCCCYCCFSGYELVYDGMERESICKHLSPGHQYRVRVCGCSPGGQGEVRNPDYTPTPRVPVVYDRVSVSTCHRGISTGCGYVAVVQVVKARYVTQIIPPPLGFQ